MYSTFAYRPDRAVIIANPAAGTVSTALVTELTRRCRLRVGNVSVHWATDRGEVTRIATRYAERSVADRPGSTVLLAVGGDGTARAAVHGLASHAPGNGAVVMFIVPAGTSNSCYRSFWGEHAWQDALDAALANPAALPRRLDLARLSESGMLVLSGASTGFPPQAIRAAKALTGLDGRARYSRALADVAASFEPYPGRVVVDGVEVHSGQTMLANVGGSRYRGGHFELLPHSVVDDGFLDVCVIGGEHDPADMLELTRTGVHVTRSGVAYARGRTVTIERTDGHSVPFEHDGELLASPGSRFTLEVVPHAVSMLVGNTADLGRRADAA
jgi:diacylglycerol kinase (ATP)